MAKRVETYTASLLRDYVTSTTAGDLTHTTEEQYIGQAIKTFSAATLDRGRLMDRYKDTDTGTYYLLMTLDLHDAQDAMLQATDVNSRIKEFVREYAEQAFARLEKEETTRPTP